jgi:hypothetical protein
MLVNFSAVKTSIAEDDAVVNAALELASKKYSTEKYDAADYEAKRVKTNVAFAARLVSGDKLAESEFEKNGLAAFRNPMVYNAPTIHRNFNVILAETVTSVIPTVVNDVYSKFLAEVHNGGWGDTGRFVIESNDLFRVNAKAEGIRAGVSQPMYNNEFTLSAREYEISTSIGWYELASGVFDIGNYALKIARSFEAHIFLKIIAAMISASSQFGAAYNTNGVTPTLWGTLRDRVSAANGGMKVIAIGTRVALSSVTLDGNFQVQIGEEMNKVGYLDQYLSVPLIALENVLIPGTTNGDAQLALSDKIIYFVPVAGSNRPVKIFMEGNQVSIEEDTTKTADRQYAFYVDLRYEVSAIVGYKYGTITLA